MAKEAHIAYKDRVLIQNLLNDGVSYQGIGVILNKHRNTIAREVSRVTTSKKSYDAMRAQILVR